MSSLSKPAVITENRLRYCLLFGELVSTFATGPTAVVDGSKGEVDVIADSNVVGECVRIRLQFRFNSVVIVSFEGERTRGEIREAQGKRRRTGTAKTGKEEAEIEENHQQRIDLRRQTDTHAHTTVTRGWRRRQLR